MTVVETLLVVRDALKNWANQSGGTVEIAIDNVQMWELAALSQDFPRVILSWDRQEPRGEADVADVLGKVDNFFQAMVTRGRGYDASVGSDLVGSDGANQGSSPPFYDLVEQARDAIRLMNITDETNESPVYYRGTEKVPYDPQVPIYAYIVNFSIGTVIGDTVPLDQNN